MIFTDWRAKTSKANDTQQKISIKMCIDNEPEKQAQYYNVSATSTIKNNCLAILRGERMPAFSTKNRKSRKGQMSCAKAAQPLRLRPAKT